ncbi:hypothetical protein CROQUDRAFT_88911 [Cronartium quercuum f. sp. fusiforme G11]|uniref:Lysophospholipase n=1 Tax=Cronartium quercuum f. sp. fusiforme G11 TaxID=708437 RepID=A0A9P6TF57_9BASI|nr:hypothetical protein CROQUDRAFT_88911 [Cronartium quercuum f. sp. fusiforme G11]
MRLTISIITIVSLPFVVINAAQTPHSYAAQYTGCPSESIIRQAGTVEKGTQALGKKESTYVEERRKRVIPGAYRDYLSNVEESLRGHSERLPSYVRRILRGDKVDRPHVSAAISGGGLRASYVGAGVLNGFDGRNSSAVAAGTGGLLQALDYITGLSGGACLVMSLAQANFPSIHDLALGPRSLPNLQEEAAIPTGSNRGWLTDINFVAPATLDLAKNGLWWTTIAGDVVEKAAGGFKVSVADIYARVLGYHFVNGTTRSNFFDPNAPHALGETMSSLWRMVPTLRNFSQPFPLITAIPDSPGQGRENVVQGAVVPLTNNQYEFGIFESGSWDPNLATFIETERLGSLPGSGHCVENFDNLGFLVAASSNIFRKYDNLVSALLPKAYVSLFPRIETVLSLIPNPFLRLGTDEYLDKNTETLGLMDGSFGGENIPFAPLLVPAREVDVILAVDASDDTGTGWPDGSTLLATSKRSRLFPPRTYPFPNVTDISSLSRTRPSFIGCTASVGTPLIVYIPNAPPVPTVPTVSLEVSREEGVSVLDAAITLAITSDPLWGGCLACAVVDRTRARVGEKRLGFCATCFNRYCFDQDNLESSEV